MLRRSWRTIALLLVGLFVLPQWGDIDINAQPSSRRTSRDDGPSVNELESKADAAFKDYLKNLAELASGYEEGGDIDKAKSTLRQILKLEPDASKVKEKIKELENAVFDANRKGFELDTSKGWVSTGLTVKKGEAVRFETDGTYKIVLNTDLGPNGMGTADAQRDMSKGVNFGALTGIVLPAPGPRARPGSNNNAKPGEPFQIGDKAEITPDTDGMLFLKVNAPPGSKCIGDLRVRISGNIAGTLSSGR